MHIEHIALYCNDLEKMKDFYCRYFEGTSNEIYRSNTTRGFESYFISFATGARFELMKKPGISDVSSVIARAENPGFVHLAFSAGSREKVDTLTKTLRADGFAVLGEPRVTGDGYYESVIADPEGNRIEITE
ncbi:VOC family protein [Danxiaibacter flavus]|uniref:VOC family protein n=1 Tax=Danxiaibacter flavus TaxID=3049108 RepID=A0ABV3ZD78_9BACT|nr:VOC family protein [Chitinophagaceae bacterium DXS]